MVVPSRLTDIAQHAINQYIMQYVKTFIIIYLSF